jgi:hypothetical protein
MRMSKKCDPDWPRTEAGAKQNSANSKSMAGRTRSRFNSKAKSGFCLLDRFAYLSKLENDIIAAN